ncbi:TIGR02677 family protein [Rugosimonospora africana]|uniref:Uncharacterized protein n=1 Tax=Rugosimonospora africana TaxID=556532 RepID=A0A8J3QYN0_9ACTN|nr:TIGR02677 family protein [Rugosimonospora africana]GIH19669.1 hypothetical protein Raf01_78410 [Rugosimonospora africana]
MIDETDTGGQRPVLRRVPTDMFAFTVTDRADLHSAVMQVLGEANERLASALTFDEILAGLRDVGWFEPVADANLDYTLGALHKYGLVERTQNHSAHYASADEYERRNLHYSLSRKGEAAYEGVQYTLQFLACSGALQTAVLDAITDRLGELHELLGVDGGDRRIYTALAELEGHLQGLQANTKQFNAQLQRLLRDEGADLATFQEVKQATIAYVTEFVTDLDQRQQIIAAAIKRVEERGVTVLHHRALHGADPAQPARAVRPGAAVVGAAGGAVAGAAGMVPPGRRRTSARGRRRAHPPRPVPAQRRAAGWAVRSAGNHRGPSVAAPGRRAVCGGHRRAPAGGGTSRAVRVRAGAGRGADG